MFCTFVFTASCKADAGPKASSEEESDDGTADVIEVLASCIEALLEEQDISAFSLHSTSPAWYHAYTTLFWLTFWTSYIDYFSSMCVGLTSSSFNKHSSSRSSSHIIFLILLISSFLSNQQAPKFQHIPFHHSFPVQPISITEVRPVASHQRLVTALPSNICTVTTSSSSTPSSTATSGGIFDPSVTLASLVELQLATTLTPSTSFLSDENVNLNTPQPGCSSHENWSSHDISFHRVLFRTH